MATIQVKNLPEDVLRAWKVRAAASGQSLQEYMRSYLTAQASKPTLGELFNRIDRRPDSGGRINPGDVVEAIHEAREERDAQWSS